MLIFEQSKSGRVNAAQQPANVSNVTDIPNEFLRTDMGKNARKYAEKHFPISLIADGFETVLRQVVAN